MSAFDYGAIVIKNGKIITEQEYGMLGMKHFVNWEDDDVQTNYFVFIGNENITISFYKCCMTVFSNKIKVDDYFMYDYGTCGTKQKSFDIYVSGLKIKVKMISDDVYHISTRIDGNNYQVVFGFGVPYNKIEWKIIKKYKTYFSAKERRKIDNILKKYW